MRKRVTQEQIMDWVEEDGAKRASPCSDVLVELSRERERFDVQAERVARLEFAMKFLNDQGSWYCSRWILSTDMTKACLWCRGKVRRNEKMSSTTRGRTNRTACTGRPSRS